MPKSAIPRPDEIPGQTIKEKEWVASLVLRLAQSLLRFGSDEATVGVVAGRKLAYTSEIHKYLEDDPNEQISSGYETDLLIFDIFEDKTWIPRVIVECKLAKINSHDALTYSAKAATHKHVHPFIRYGILLGQRQHFAIPGRLVKHGAYFDFMVAWTSTTPNKGEWRSFTKLLGEEIVASRSMLDLLTTSRSKQRKKYHIFRRRLVLE